MTTHSTQGTLFPDDDGVDEKTTRSLLDHLLTESKLYKTGEAYKALLAFIVEMRNFAPFNAMLIHIQKPGIRFAASAHDWAFRFGRSPKQDARPLLILRPFGPVALVYDIADTEGRDLPESVLHAFIAKGPVEDSDISHYLSLMAKESISCRLFDGGDGNAGSIRLDHITHKPKERHFYCMAVNRNHSAAVMFSTLAHELAHLFLGHLGKDARLNIPDRSGRTHDQIEIEAESVAYLVCKRRREARRWSWASCNTDPARRRSPSRDSEHTTTMNRIAPNRFRKAFSAKKLCVLFLNFQKQCLPPEATAPLPPGFGVRPPAPQLTQRPPAPPR